MVSRLRVLDSVKAICVSMKWIIVWILLIVWCTAYLEIVIVFYSFPISLRLKKKILKTSCNLAILHWMYGDWYVADFIWSNKFKSSLSSIDFIDRVFHYFRIWGLVWFSWTRLLLHTAGHEIICSLNISGLVSTTFSYFWVYLYCKIIL